MTGTSLQSLVQQHGFGIRVRSTNPNWKYIEFNIVGEGEEGFYKVHFDDGTELEFKKYLDDTNDYEIVT